MSTILFRRPARRQPPEMPSGELSLQEPPVMPEEPTGNMGLLLTFLPMALGLQHDDPAVRHPRAVGGPTTWLAGGLMMVTTMSMMVGQMGRTTSTRKRRTKGERRDYLRYLTQTRKKVRQQTAQQRKALAWIHPDPARALVGRDERAAVGTAPGAPRLRRGQGRHRAAALRGQDQPDADQAGGGPGAAVRQGAAPVHQRPRHRARPAGGGLPARLRPDHPARRPGRGPRPRRARCSPSSSSSTRPTTSASRCAAATQTDRRLGVDEVAAALPAPGAGRRGRPGPGAAADAGRGGRPVRRRSSPSGPGTSRARRPAATSPTWSSSSTAGEPSSDETAVRRRRVPQRGADRRRRRAYRGGTPSGRLRLDVTPDRHWRWSRPAGRARRPGPRSAAATS